MTAQKNQRKRMSYAATEEGVKVAYEAYRRHGSSRELFSSKTGISLSTLTRFFSRASISRDSFKSICAELRLDWTEIAGLVGKDEPEQTLPNETESLIVSPRTFSNIPIISEKVATELAISLKKIGVHFLDYYKIEQKNSEKEIDLLFPIAKKYIENYTIRYGMLKVLGMGKPVSLDSVYTKVNFDREFIQTFTIDELENSFRGKERNEKECQSGMEVANQQQYLMVLGGPGNGKTTFLRKVGLEALKQGAGEYQHLCLPVFIELRKYRWEKGEKIDLEAKIAEEFQQCGLPEYQNFTNELLEQGKFLILLDGLDEVPMELLGQMTTAIKDLVDRYSKNRFIASCRVAAYRPFQNFSRFTDVAITNFDEQQIRSFIARWFESHEKPGWGDECWKRLDGSDHQATRELARTPLLLTLICILFLKRGEFPAKRATLYAEALWTLLSEWDASKEIVRQQPYRGLDTKCKEVMLAEIAYSNFISNNLLFQQGEISNQIEQILQEMLTEEKRIDGRDVLRTVEEQHGILVNRYDDIYSFSHLTIQEFLTAKHIIDNDIDVGQLVAEHLCDKRWHELFLLLAGLKKADDLLLTMEREIGKYVAAPKLQRLLEWIDEVISRQTEDFQMLGNRVMAIAVICAIASTNSITNSKALDHFIRYAQWTVEFQNYEGSCFASMILELEELKSQIPSDEQSQQIRQAFTSQLIKLWMKNFNVMPEIMELSDAEIQALDNYLYGTQLLIECERAAVRRTPEVWSQIEKRLLRKV